MKIKKKEKKRKKNSNLHNIGEVRQRYDAARHHESSHNMAEIWLKMTWNIISITLMWFRCVYSNRTFYIAVIPLGCMLKRREFDVEVEYHSSKPNMAPRSARMFGRQISLPNGFLSHPLSPRQQRTKSTSDLLKDDTESEGIIIIFSMPWCSFKIYNWTFDKTKVESFAFP